MAQYLADESDQGQILVLVINEIGDHQMNAYFRPIDGAHGGMICEGGAGMDDVFDTMKEIHRNSFQELGGEYIPRDEDEKTCAIRLPPNIFFKVMSPSNLKFDTNRIIQE